MNFIHVVTTLPRLVDDAPAARLRVMPAVVLTGARQTGKSTLVEKLVPGDRLYRSLDDFDVRDAVRRDPEALLGGDDPLTLDEVQREPGLLTAVKRAIDRDRRPGRFLLTGSANLLLMRQVSESLAGRASYLTLWPMTRCEQLGLARAGRWDDLLATPDGQWRDLLAAADAAEDDWQALALRGGFPTPALELKTPADRAIWFDGYVRTYLERDLQDLASISALPDFRRLLQAACLRVGQLLNQTELGRDVGLPQPTVHRWLNLLETSYLLVRLPAYSVNRTKRLVNSPRMFWGDTGVALHLGSSAPAGAHLENLVLNDLLAWRDARVDRVELAYWRTTIGEEVDFVIEAGGKLLPIQVKATSKPRLGDCAHLRTFRQEYGRKARAGSCCTPGTRSSGSLPTCWRYRGGGYCDEVLRGRRASGPAGTPASDPARSGEREFHGVPSAHAIPLAIPAAQSMARRGCRAIASRSAGGHAPALQRGAAHTVPKSSRANPLLLSGAAAGCACARLVPTIVHSHPECAYLPMQDIENGRKPSWMLGF